MTNKEFYEAHKGESVTIRNIIGIVVGYADREPKDHMIIGGTEDMDGWTKAELEPHDIIINDDPAIVCYWYAGYTRFK